MSPKFSGAQAARPAPPVAPVRTTGVAAATHEGAGAWERDPRSDLFLLAVTNMVGEDTFYERADARDERFRQLVARVTADDPAWVARFVPFLRGRMNMRSASVAMACEYARAGGPNGRAVVDSACLRADEPAEVLGYWTSRYGRRIPMPVKRGVADACRRLYTQRAALRYDGQSRSWRMGDVLDLTHPRPRDDEQSALFKLLLDYRHGRRDRIPSTLRTMVDDAVLSSWPEAERRSLLRAVTSGEDHTGLWEGAKWSWERLSGWLPGGMDAEAWGFAAPSMGVMALLRNLRNFDEAGLAQGVREVVAAKLRDPDEVRASRAFPFRVWAAYREAPSDFWRPVLGDTFDLAAANVPRLDRSLVVVDCSGSMTGVLSGRSTMHRWEVAAVAAAALWKGTEGTEVVAFGDTSKKLAIPRGSSALRVAEAVARIIDRNEVGSATYGHTAIRDHFDPARHRRVVLVTDDQMWDSMGPEESQLMRWHPQYRRAGVDVSHVPLIHTVNLAGHAPSSLEAGARGRYSWGGLSDAAFLGMEAVESGRDGSWPF